MTPRRYRPVAHNQSDNLPAKITKCIFAVASPQRARPRWTAADLSIRPYLILPSNSPMVRCSGRREVEHERRTGRPQSSMMPLQLGRGADPSSGRRTRLDADSPALSLRGSSEVVAEQRLACRSARPPWPIWCKMSQLQGGVAVDQPERQGSVAGGRQQACSMGTVRKRSKHRAGKRGDRHTVNRRHVHFSAGAAPRAQMYDGPLDWASHCSRLRVTSMNSGSIASRQDRQPVQYWRLNAVADNCGVV